DRGVPRRRCAGRPPRDRALPAVARRRRRHDGRAARGEDVPERLARRRRLVNVAVGTAFELATAARIVFGAGSVREAVPAVTALSRPFVAIPTTAGTGAEVTRNAVLADPHAGVKASLRSPFMLPALAIVDPDLLVGLPAAVLAASGVDALSQLVEPYLSARANPLTDGLAREGMRRSARSLADAATVALTAERREALALASLMGGLWLA